MKIIILLLSLSIIGCSAIVGKNNNSKLIQLSEAKGIAKNYLMARNMLWGEPTSVRVSSKHYIFFYNTPEHESKIIGGRILNVDKVSGEVSVPPRL
jgi:hypothetical protein